jgi:hypothetical protein
VQVPAGINTTSQTGSSETEWLLNTASVETRIELVEALLRVRLVIRIATDKEISLVVVGATHVGQYRKERSG